MKITKLLLALLCVVGLSFAIGCEDESEIERTSEDVARDVENATEDAADDLDAAAEDAADSIEEATE